MTGLWSRIGESFAGSAAEDPPPGAGGGDLEREIEAALRARAATLASAGPEMVLADVLPQALADGLHEVALTQCMRTSRTKEHELLHAARKSEHYFDCDTFLVRPSLGRRVATAGVSVAVRQFALDHLACAISPASGLVGAYPLCYAVGLPLDLSVVATRPVTAAEIRITGGYQPGAGAAMIVTDVFTTGTTVIRLAERLRAKGLTVVGAIGIFDRLEGAADSLAQAGIDYLATMSRRSLRAFAESRLRDPAFEDADGAARDYLAASRTLSLRVIEAGAAPKPVVRAALAACATPPLGWFDEHLQLRAEHRAPQRERVRDAIAQAAAEDCSLVAFPELTLPLDMRDELAAASAERGMVIAGGCEYNDQHENVGLIAFSGKALQQAKTLRSPYDLPDLVTGDQAYVIRGTVAGDVGLVICADHASYELIDTLRHRVDVLLVAARNRAVGTFASMAAGDAYRLGSYVLTVNDPAIGVSFLAAPRKGPSKLELFPDAGRGLRYVELDIAGLAERGPGFLRDLG